MGVYPCMFCIIKAAQRNVLLSTKLTPIKYCKGKNVLWADAKDTTKTKERVCVCVCICVLRITFVVKQRAHLSGMGGHVMVM